MGVCPECLADGVEVEHRRIFRYLLRAPVAFSWEGPEQTHVQGEGMIRDVSTSGAFVFCSTLPPSGSTIQLSIQLPPIRSKAPSLQMEGLARVIRLEPDSDGKGQCGFAVVTKRFSLRSNAVKNGPNSGELFDSGGRSDV